MRTIVLNRQSIVPGTNNSELEYVFPGGGVSIGPGDKLALSSLTMFYSTPNITTLNNNTSYAYEWKGVTYPVVMPDGFYEVAQINDFLHQTMINNKHYLVETSTNNFVYFITLAVNTVTYKIDATVYPLSIALYPALDYTIPAGADWDLSVLFSPSLTILPNSFGNVIGFAAGSYGTVTVTTVFSSTFTPQVSPLSTFLLKCSLVNNSYSVPNSVIYSFPPFGSFGRQFTVIPPEFSFLDLQTGSYSTFRISLTDQNDRPISILDPDICILLVIKSSKE